VTLLDALQRAVAAEHAAVYGYGLVGSQLGAVELEAAQAAYTAHQTRRDAIARLIRDRHAQPVTAPPAYRPRAAVRGRTAAFRLAVQLEEDAVSAYVAVLAQTDVVAVRRAAVGWLSDATVRAQSWRTRQGPAVAAAAPPLPGLVACPVAYIHSLTTSRSCDKSSMTASGCTS
jgi:hypothetical protein